MTTNEFKKWCGVWVLGGLLSGVLGAFEINFWELAFWVVFIPAFIGMMLIADL